MFSEALNRAWEIFRDRRTRDLFEIVGNGVSCQLSVDRSGWEPAITVTYALQENTNREFPEYFLERFNGDGLYIIRYK